MNSGYIYALTAYLLWGLFPLYWQPLEHIPATQLIGHRIVWAFVFQIALLAVLGQLGRLRPLLRDRRIVRIYASAGALLAANWLTYVWGVTHGHVVEASLGYFINPLFSVLLGLVVLKEHLRKWQWAAIGLASLGVGYLTWSYGHLPWIALALTLTFGLYGLVTKTAPLDAVDGLTLETGLLFLPALAFLLWEEWQGQGAFGHVPAFQNLLMGGAGVVTAVPLLFFGAAVRQVPLSVMGILQYLSPTLQFLLGVLAFHEPFTSTHFIGYSMVWLALLIFWVEGWRHQHNARPGVTLP